MRKCTEGLFIGIILTAVLVVFGIGYMKSGIQEGEQKVNEIATVYETQAEFEKQSAYEAVVLQLIEDTSKSVTDAYATAWEQVESFTLAVARENAEASAGQERAEAKAEISETEQTIMVQEEAVSAAPAPEPVLSAPVMTVDDLLQAINAERSKAGLAAFVWNDSLSAAASVRGVEIVSCFGHTRPDGTDFFTVSELAMAENLARGYFYTTADEVVEKWMESDTGHKQNILDGGLTMIGIHIYEYEDRIAICVLFG